MTVPFAPAVLAQVIGLIDFEIEAGDIICHLAGDFFEMGDGVVVFLFQFIQIAQGLDGAVSRNILSLDFCISGQSQ